MATYDLLFTGVTSGTALKTLAQVAMAATAVRAELVEWSVTFDGTSASAVPVLIQLNRQTSAGTGGVSATPAPRDSSEAATAANAGLTCLTGPTAATWTTEPTAGTVCYNARFTPVGLGPSWQYPAERAFWIPASGRLAVVITAAVAVNCTGHMAIKV